MKRIGVIGGGQLARMMIPAAINLAIELRVFAEQQHAPASLAVTAVGDFRDVRQVADFAADLDALTFDHEHVPAEVLRAMEDSGIVVAPSSQALALTHNKVVMRQKLRELGVAQPRWCEVSETSELESAVESVGGYPCIAKKPTGGYDGKGVRVAHSASDLEDWLSQGSLLLEEKVPFVRELALLSARRTGGEWKPWAPVETRQKNGVCSEVIAPAQSLSEPQLGVAEELARRIAEGVGTVGVLAVEVFELADGSLSVNELAMRPHNSGHVFTELSTTSQFEQHLRAVADLPLGSAALVAPAGVMVNLFGGVDADAKNEAWERVPEAKIHDYGKGAREGRKVGHVVVTGDDVKSLLDKAELARSALRAAVRLDK